MTETSEKLDYSKTLYLPQTEFPMRAGLPEKEPRASSSAGRTWTFTGSLRASDAKGRHEIRPA